MTALVVFVASRVVTLYIHVGYPCLMFLPDRQCPSRSGVRPSTPRSR